MHKKKGERKRKKERMIIKQNLRNTILLLVYIKIIIRQNNY